MQDQVIAQDEFIGWRDNNTCSTLKLIIQFSLGQNDHSDGTDTVRWTDD